MWWLSRATGYAANPAHLDKVLKGREQSGAAGHLEQLQLGQTPDPRPAEVAAGHSLEVALSHRSGMLARGLCVASAMPQPDASSSRLHLATFNEACYPRQRILVAVVLLLGRGPYIQHTVPGLSPTRCCQKQLAC